MIRRAALLILAVVWGGTLFARAPRPEIDNVAAFARIYGVVRYFHPSDAAASLDWDGFATYGVRRVRAAADVKSLESTLNEMFKPLGQGIEIGRTLPAPPQQGKPDKSLVAWRYLGPGISLSSPGPYKGKRTNRALVVTTTIDGFASMMQTVPAEQLRGKTIRLRGRVRATAHDPTGSAALWLRVDRVDSKMGFFDNMGDRPVREPDWREYTIEGPVADDATSVAFGVMASGGITADFDEIDLAVQDDKGGWTVLSIKDDGFEAATSSADWNHVGNSRNAQVTRVADSTPGKQFLRIAAPSVPPVTMELFDDTPPVASVHDTDLGSGLKGRVPLALTEQAAAGQSSNAALETLRSALRAGRGPATDLDTRLADVVVAWNVFRHFYPYWTEAGVAWDSRLGPQLEIAYSANSRQAHHDALRLVVADVRDGHGRVTDQRQTTPRAALPLRFGIIEEQLVVTASHNPAVPVGSVVTSIDSVPAMKRIADAMALASGTTQWKQTRALQEVAGCDPPTAVSLALDTGTGPRSASLRCEAMQQPMERRPEAITELADGIWYVDLTRASMAQIRPRLETLAKAAGVIFDVRGYPTDSGAQILPYLVDAPETDRWMHIAKIVGPFHQTAGWWSVGWNVEPVSPRFGGRIVFMTDGRAISYAESVMGYVKDRKLGTVVGSATAGANGNVVSFQVPGRFVVTFTGMRVTGHDGQTPHHLRGVLPDILAAPTVAGIRAGRDEVLERAIAVVRENQKGSR